jgi:hypothetical protein
MKNKFNLIFHFLNKNETQNKIKFFNYFLSLVSIGYIYIFIKKNYPEYVLNFNFQFLHLLFLFLSYFITGVIWVNYINNSKVDNFKYLFFDWSFSNLGKYIPGSLGLITMRLDQKNNKNIGSKSILIGLLEEQFIAPIIMLPVLATSLIYINSNFYFLILFFLTLIYFFLFKKLYLSKLFKKKKTIISSHKLYFISLLMNMSFVFIVFSNYDFANFKFLSIYYLISANLGLFFVGVPAGAGIREALFLFLLKNSSVVLPNFNAILYIRGLYLCADVLFGLLGLFFKLKNK